MLCVSCLSQHYFGVIALTVQSTITPKKSAPIFSLNSVFMGTFMISIISVSGIGIDFIELIYHSRAGKFRLLLVNLLFIVQSMLWVNLFLSAYCVIFIVRLIFAIIKLCRIHIEIFLAYKSVNVFINCILRGLPMGGGAGNGVWQI